MFSGNGAGTSGDPYQITSWAQLHEIRDDMTAHYILMNDLDENSTGYATYAAATANTGYGWQPLGIPSDWSATGTVSFTGSFDGNYKTIANVRMNPAGASREDLLGLFYTLEGSVKDLRLIDIVVVSAERRVGTLARNIGNSTDAVGTHIIENIHIQGSVSASLDGISQIGGICYFINGGFIFRDIMIDVDLISTNNQGSIGGICALKNGNSTFDNILYRGVITTTSTSDVNGLIASFGTGGSASQVENSFWDEDVAGTSTGTAGTAKTTAQMKTRATFADTATTGLDTAWDIAAADTYDDTKTWGIGDIAAAEINDGYPYLMGFEEAGVVTPTVTTQAVTDIAKTTATGNGNVTADGGETITERGVCWATTTTPTTADNTATSAGTTGAFTAAMTGLTADTLYYVRAYAINSEGTSYGDEVTFTTLALDNPTVTTQAATSVGSGGATLNGNVTSLGDFDPVDARFQYRETSSGTWLETSLATDVTTGAYTFGLTGLDPETEYEFRAKVEYDTDQEAFGDTLTFTTLAGDTAPPLTTGAATVVRATLATANGEVTSDGGQTVTERGFVWATTTAPDVTDNKVEVAGTTGEYSVGLSGLPAETLVYLRAYAINSVGTSYGNEVSFTTLALSAVKNPMYRNDGGVLKRIN